MKEIKALNFSSNFLNSTSAASKNDVEYMSIEAVKEYISSHILPCICLVGVLTNLINLYVFSNREKLKSAIYKYMMLHSALDLAYLLATFLYFFAIKIFFLNDSFVTKLSEIYLLRMFTTAMAIFMILIEILISTKRLLIVLNYNITFRFGFRLFALAFFLFSMSTQIPFILSSHIALKPNATTTATKSYQIVPSSYGKSKAFNIYNMAFFLFRGVLVPVSLFTINMVMLIHFRKRIKKKMNLQSIEKCESNKKFFNFLRV